LWHSQRQALRKTGYLDTEGELYADIVFACHLYNLGKLDRLLGCSLQVIDGEDLEARIVDL
jgi:hypothetical protein